MTQRNITCGIDWNNVTDPNDLQAWNTATSNFWLPEKIALSNDIPSWELLNEHERLLVLRVFVGLTLLDTIQSVVGAPRMTDDAITDHEEAVYTNFSFMEAVHAKSYSSIFSTLSSSKEIDAIFRWSRENPLLQTKAAILQKYYRGADKHKVKILSVFMESFMFYSGFYTPLRFAARGKLTNTADLIRLIIRDESLHGIYTGYKYQKGIESLNQEEKDELHLFALEVIADLMQVEERYAEQLYDGIGWTEDVKGYLRYNANKALSQMGYESIYPRNVCEYEPTVLAAQDMTGENHDFFSGAGSSYVMAKVEATTNDDWDFDVD